jgi:hypothetical protein
MDYEIRDLQQNAFTATQSSDKNEWTRWGFIYFYSGLGEEADNAVCCNSQIS